MRAFICSQEGPCHDPACSREVNEAARLLAHCALPASRLQRGGVAYEAFTDLARQITGCRWRRFRWSTRTACGSNRAAVSMSREMPREESFSTHVVAIGQAARRARRRVRQALSRQPARDRRTPHVRFYAGVPLYAPGGHVIGALCVFDERARTLSRAAAARVARCSANALMNLLESRRRMLGLFDAAHADVFAIDAATERSSSHRAVRASGLATRRKNWSACRSSTCSPHSRRRCCTTSSMRGRRGEEIVREALSAPA